MTIKLMFEINSNYFIITIDKKVITYSDAKQNKLWGGPLQWLPHDPTVFSKIRASRNKIPMQMINLFLVPEEEMKEFQNAKDDNELRDLVIRDAKLHFCKLIKEESDGKPTR